MPTLMCSHLEDVTAFLGRLAGRLNQLQEYRRGGEQLHEEQYLDRSP